MISKILNTRGVVNMQSCYNTFNLRDYQFKIIAYLYRLLYINLMVTIGQKSIIDTHTRQKGIYIDTKDNHQVIRRKKEKQKINLKT